MGVTDMKKLVVTTNNANDAVQLTIQQIVPNVNGCTKLAQITLPPSQIRKLRDDLTRILEHPFTPSVSTVPLHLDIPIAPKLAYEYQKAMHALSGDR
jgi:hypothetical protein